MRGKQRARESKMKVLLHKPLSVSGLWLSGKGSACQSRRPKRLGFDPWVRKMPWRRKWQPTPVFSPLESHGQRSLGGYSLWGHKELDTAEHLNSCQPVSPGGPAVSRALRRTRGPGLGETDTRPIEQCFWVPNLESVHLGENDG